MEIAGDVCYRALEARDARFDGKFFTAVKTTGVYCRPICPAKTPHRRNCSFYRSAAAAAEAGYRPCLRCRPESSPGTPAWAGTSATVTRALRLIGEGALVDSSADALAARLGVGARHLRRLFVEHLGAPPAAVEQTRRIHFAKKLLDETEIPITQIAFSAGFNSVRRFNAAMRGAYDRSPRELRNGGARKPREARIRLRLGYRPPFDWKQVLGFLAVRAIPGVESVRDDVYARSLAVGSFRGVVRLRPGAGDWLELETPSEAAAELPQIVARARAVFDLGADPHKIAAQLVVDPSLRKLVRRRPGLRVPGAWDPFEMSVRAVVGQQVTVRGATTVAGRLTSTYGERLDGSSEDIDRLFPSPRDLLAMEPEGHGMPHRRAQAVRTLARTVVDRPAFFDEPAEQFIESLCELPGFGPWTAHYTAMRALGHPDAFPGSDLGLRKAISAIDGGEVPTLAQLERRAEAWRPWRSYAAMLLWSSLGTGE